MHPPTRGVQEGAQFGKVYATAFVDTYRAVTSGKSATEESPMMVFCSPMQACSTDRSVLIDFGFTRKGCAQPIYEL